MTMQDLNGRRVKLSARTITAKDENGKTCGMVRNLERYTDMAFRRQSELKNVVSPLWRNKCGLPLDRLYFDGKQGYYIFCAGYVPPYEMDRYNAKMAVLEAAKANGLEIICVASI